ncbi:MAG: thiamine-phosphate kinase [Rickettsiales bacterium]|nr:thiamine-phosphate kinase [Rickettsiales bacterium]
MREFSLIEKFFKPLTNSCKAAHNLADDVAKISLKKDEELVISKDMFVEDVHFLLKDGGFKIASKLLRTNLSDLASSGATPLYYMMGFSKNKNTNEEFCSEFARGLKSVQDEFGLCLIGGDTVSAKKLCFSITIFGVVKKGQSLSRGLAKEGDLVFVSGTIGDAFIGRKAAFDAHTIKRHFFPTPRIELGKMLLKNNLSSCAIDVSDGLLADLGHICQASKLAAEIHLNQVPFSKSAQKFFETNSKIKPLNLLSGGDDYELVFAVAPKNKNKILTLAKALKLELTCIGEFKKAADKNFGVSLIGAKNKKITLKKLGHEH